MSKLISLQCAFFAGLLLLALSGCGHKNTFETQEKGYHHLVVLGDPHIPGPNLAAKKRVLETINTWKDVDAVVAVGDICMAYGTDEEYAAAREFFQLLHKPFFPVAGNHDYFYTTPAAGTAGGYMVGSLASQQAKLKNFCGTFGLEHYSYTKEIGGYFLIFLSTDHERFVAGIGEAQLQWLSSELASHPNTPTIIIFHGPLKGTQHNFKRYINLPQSVAQPVEAIEKLIAQNPQVFLWVSGHTHTPPTEESYHSPVNVYAGQVTNIHNTDMKGETLWTNSLYLYPDRVEVRTYNHQEQKWVPALERRVQRPAL